MKKSEVRVGGVYIAKVSGNLTRVRVDAIREKYTEYGFISRTETHYDVTNLATGRKTTFRSATKFRGEVKPKVGLEKKVPGGQYPTKIVGKWI